MIPPHSPPLIIHKIVAPSVFDLQHLWQACLSHLASLPFSFTKMQTFPLLSLSPPPEGYSVELIYDSSTQPQGALAQLPRTLLDTMMEAHIPPADAERLISRFNRVSFSYH